LQSVAVTRLPDLGCERIVTKRVWHGEGGIKLDAKSGEVIFVNLDNTQITGAGLEHLKGMTGLKVLDLDGTQITDAGLEHLKGMTSLKTLSLGATQITGAGFEHLKGLTSLEWLYLDRTPITDAGLEHLKEMTSLSGLVDWGSWIRRT